MNPLTGLILGVSSLTLMAGHSSCPPDLCSSPFPLLDKLTGPDLNRRAGLTLPFWLTSSSPGTSVLLFCLMRRWNLLLQLFPDVLLVPGSTDWSSGLDDHVHLTRTRSVQWMVRVCEFWDVTVGEGPTLILWDPGDFLSVSSNDLKDWIQVSDWLGLDCTGSDDGE